jgi:hypothetical protein
MTSAFAIGTFPSPPSSSSRAGATSQASAAIGSAAAAQTAKIFRSEYWGISTWETAAPGRDRLAPSAGGTEASVWILPLLRQYMARLELRAEGGTFLELSRAGLEADVTLWADFRAVPCRKRPSADCADSVRVLR